MKTRKILAIAIIAIMFLALFIGTVNAAASRTFQLLVTTKTYTVGQEGTDTSANQTVEVGKTLQLKAYVNEKNESSPGVVEGESNTEEETVTNTIVAEATPTWRSADTTIATISSTGLITAVKAGTTSITASYTYQGQSLGTTVNLTVTGTPEPTEDWTDFSNVTFKLEEFTRFNNITLTFKNFTPKENHKYTTFVTQNASYAYDETMTLPISGTSEIEKDKDKNTYYTNLRDDNARMAVEETKDAYLVVVETDNSTSTTKRKMVLKPTKIEKANVKANLGGGYLESFHVNSDRSSFYNTVYISDSRKITYKFGEVTDTSILNAISKEESGSFAKLLAYAKADTKPLTSGSFNFSNGGYDTANIAKATGKVAADKYYYVYEVADTESGKYVSIEDVVVFNGSDDGILTHFAFAGTSTDDPYTSDGNTTNPTNVSGDNSIATKKIPQTGATPVFMIVFGSVILVAAIVLVANKKYRDIQ